MAKEAIPPAKYTDRPTPRNRTEQVHHLVTHTDKSLVPVKTNKQCDCCDARDVP